MLTSMSAFCRQLGAGGTTQSPRSTDCSCHNNQYPGGSSQQWTKIKVNKCYITCTTHHAQTRTLCINSKAHSCTSGGGGTCTRKTARGAGAAVCRVGAIRGSPTSPRALLPALASCSCGCSSRSRRCSRCGRCRLGRRCIRVAGVLPRVCAAATHARAAAVSLAAAAGAGAACIVVALPTVQHAAAARICCIVCSTLAGVRQYTVCRRDQHKHRLSCCLGFRPCGLIWVVLESKSPAATKQCSSQEQTHVSS